MEKHVRKEGLETGSKLIGQGRTSKLQMKSSQKLNLQPFHGIIAFSLCPDTTRGSGTLDLRFRRLLLIFTVQLTVPEPRFSVRGKISEQINDPAATLGWEGGPVLNRSKEDRFSASDPQPIACWTIPFSFTWSALFIRIKEKAGSFRTPETTRDIQMDCIGRGDGPTEIGWFVCRTEGSVVHGVNRIRRRVSVPRYPDGVTVTAYRGETNPSAAVLPGGGSGETLLKPAPFRLDVTPVFLFRLIPLRHAVS